jgi:hypothetical protein
MRLPVAGELWRHRWNRHVDEKPDVVILAVLEHNTSTLVAVGYLRGSFSEAGALMSWKRFLEAYEPSATGVTR